MSHSNLASGTATTTDTVARSFKNNGDVHSIDPNVWIVLLIREISVIPNSEGEVAFSVEVPCRD
jgi:hypothetical protein